MFDQYFVTINAWMTSGTMAAALGAFSWGLVSVLFSPCHLASIPLVIGYVAGQNRLVEGLQAVRYALAFSLGLFLTIAAVGLVCSLLGRMLGDVGPWWTLLVGGVLVYVALDMLGVPGCRLPGTSSRRVRLTGLVGAFVLGLSYGVASGACTFGFIAPILAIIAIQEKIAAGVTLIVLFALGHCLPIVVAGGSAALARRVLESGPFQRSGIWFRRGAGALIGLLGLYFLARPFVEA